MIKYNDNLIVCAVLNDFHKARFFEFKEEIKFLGFTIRKRGFYGKIWIEQEFIGTDTPENHSFINGILYENPEVILHYADGQRVVKTFLSYADAKTYYENINFITNKNLENK